MNNLACKCLLLCFLAAFNAFAANHEKLSKFEQSIVNIGLKQYKLEIDSNPADKKIRELYFYTQGPFDPNDKILSWLDHIQFRTQDSALRSQLWVAPGDTYNSNILIENERALLNQTVRSVVLIFPVQPIGAVSSTQVDLLIVTKDIFSWQVTYGIAGAGSTLSQLSLSFAQTNLLGLNKTIGVTTALDQALMNLSANYYDPSLFSSKNQLNIQQGFVLSRKDLAYQGVTGSLTLTCPFTLESVQWGYTAAFSYDVQPVYDFQGDRIRLYQDQKRQYHQLKITPNFTVTRSFGTIYKNNLSFGYGLNYGKYEPLEPVTQDFIDHVLPRSELQSFLILGYNYFQNKFVPIYDYNTFSMAEWLQLGPSLGITNNFALTPLGSDRSFFRPMLSLGISAAPSKTSFINFSLTGQTRLQSEVLNNQVGAGLTVIFPTLGPIGRFVFKASYGSLWNNINNAQFTLGADTALRGVPFQYYQGTNFVRSNLEFRTSSLPFWIFRLGLVGFYDFGSAFNSQGDFNPTHDIGLGVRILTIPWNRILMRLDVATPVGGPLAGFQNTLLTFGLGQAF